MTALSHGTSPWQQTTFLQLIYHIPQLNILFGFWVQKDLIISSLRVIIQSQSLRSNTWLETPIIGPVSRIHPMFHFFILQWPQVWWTSFCEEEMTYFSPLEIEWFCSSLAKARPSFALQCRETQTKCYTHTEVDLLALTQALTQFSEQQIKGKKGKKDKSSLLEEINMTFILVNIKHSFYKQPRWIKPCPLRYETTKSVR